MSKLKADIMEQARIVSEATPKRHCQFHNGEHELRVSRDERMKEQEVAQTRKTFRNPSLSELVLAAILCESMYMCT